jgi:hypothetical protein
MQSRWKKAQIVLQERVSRCSLICLPIVGFLQLGIQDINASGDVTTVILNAAGVDPAITGTPVIGAGASPIPVRLIHP